MRGFNRCSKCREKDFTVQPRPGLSQWLCAECNVDVRTSSTRKLTVEDVREHNDYYSHLAEKYGL